MIGRPRSSGRWIARAALVVVLATSLSGGAVALAPLPTVLAQDGDGGDDEKKKKEPTAEEKELVAIGKEFAAKDADALIARVPEKGKLRLILGGSTDRCSREQAKNILVEWFAKRTITKVKLKSSSGNVGEFTAKWRREGKEPEIVKILILKIAKVDDVFVLKSIEVQNE